MGLKPIDPARWFPRHATPAQAERKTMLLRRYGRAVLDQLPDAEQTARVASAAVGRFFQRTTGTLQEAALLVPDDLCVMRRQRDTYELAAASLSSPSYWRLQDKLGLSLADIHAAHDGLNERIGERMQRFFQRLPAGRVFQRRNWFLHADAEPYHPGPEHPEPEYPEPEEQPGASPGHCFVRSERQTLRRIDADVVLFTIDVSFLPLAAVRAHPDAAAAMLADVRGWSDQEREAFGAHKLGEDFIHYLQGKT